MHKKTKELSRRIRSLDSIEKKMDTLANAYKGEDCYILTCGPSFKRNDLDKLKDILKDKLTLSVKQTFNSMEEICDFHLLNSWNYTPYSYKNNRPIVVSERGKADPETPGMNADMLFPVTGVSRDLPREERLKHRLVAKRNYEDFLFSETLNRPWGPGVMHELGFYLAIHLGVKSITAIGWDIGERGSHHMEHFYDKAGNPQKLDNPRNLLIKQSFWKRLKLTTSKRTLVNEPGFYQGEVELIADSTDSLYDWLLEKDIQLSVMSDCSIASERIPRISLA